MEYCIQWLFGVRLLFLYVIGDGWFVCTSCCVASKEIVQIFFTSCKKIALYTYSSGFVDTFYIPGRIATVKMIVMSLILMIEDQRIMLTITSWSFTMPSSSSFSILLPCFNWCFRWCRRRWKWACLEHCGHAWNIIADSVIHLFIVWWILWCFGPWGRSMINPPCIYWSSNFRRCWTEILAVSSDSVSLICHPIIVGSQARILVDVFCHQALNGNRPERTGIAFKILGLGMS